MVVDPLGDTPTLEMGSELVAVGGVGRLDQPAGDVGGEAGGEHDGGAQVELVVDHHPLELLRTGATKPGTVPTGGLGARDVALADQPEQRQLRLAQGAGTEAIAEEAPHRTEDVALDHGLLIGSTQSTSDGYAGDQILLAPPFISSDAELDEMVSRTAAVMREVDAWVSKSL